MATLRQQIIKRVLDRSGRPLKPGSIFLGLRRAELATIKWLEALGTGQTVSFPYRFFGYWQVFTCRVERVNQFRDGVVVFTQPVPGSNFENWPVVPIWIPNIGTAGILQ